MDQDETRRKRELERDKRGFEEVGATGVALITCDEQATAAQEHQHMDQEGNRRKREL
ncbi:hypothetical protein K8O68_02955 [Salipaludibacillus sp. CUR1]|uniref:hypothetical protein n=1 Tax=Salipaludibacillus sp. CUR1 TaxID=2820003 RepID=UPI001E3FAB29|nr:hypothetical protein [Salipaludibacillus sp. CUR1]MCE7791381.1 hypothetical protein [Salipaludibacillus sp. CUR1]